VQITSSSSENFVSFYEFFQFRKKNRSHLEPGRRIWSQLSSGTGCHPKFRLSTTPSPTVFAIRVRIARQMAGWKIKNNNSSTRISQRWRNAGPSAFQLQETILKSDKIWCAYLVVNCVSLRTFWTPLLHTYLCKKIKWNVLKTFLLIKTDDTLRQQKWSHAIYSVECSVQTL